jgi:hypothetical protein
MDGSSNSGIAFVQINYAGIGQRRGLQGNAIMQARGSAP